MQDSFTTYMRLLPFGWAMVALPASDPFWPLDGNVSVFQQDFSRADALRTVELNSTTFSYVAIESEPPKITVRVPIFIGACWNPEAEVRYRCLCASLSSGVYTSLVYA